MNDLDALASGLADGITLGFGDEILGGVRATGSALTGGDFGDAYRRSVFESRNRQDEAKREHGGWYIGGQVAGSLLPALIPVVGQAGLGARAAATGARAAPGVFEMALSSPLARAMFAPQGGIANRMASGALTGGLFGGLSGVGHADGEDVGDALASGGVGALIGAPLGAALPALFGAGQAGLRALSRAATPAAAARAPSPVVEGAQSIVEGAGPPGGAPGAGGFSNETVDEFIELLRQRGVTPEQAQEQVNAFVASDPGRGRTFVDLLGNAGINRMKFLTKQPGTTADEAGRVFDARNRGQLERIESELFEGVPSAHETQKVVDEWYAREGSQLYEPLFQNELSEHGRHVFQTQIRRLMSGDPAMERAAKKGQELLARDARVQAVRGGSQVDTSDEEIARMVADIENARQVSGTQPQSLTQFVRAQGGIRDDRGDVASFAKDMRGFASLLNPRTGRQADELAEAASEAGFFPHLGRERATLREFIDALEADVRGTQKSYSRGASAAEANQADEVLNWYRSQGIDTAKRGSSLETEIREKLLFGTGGDELPEGMDTVPRRLHYIKMGIDAEIERAARAEDNTTVRSLTDLKRLYLDLLDQVMPGYERARNTWGGMAEAEDAIRLGRNILLGRKSPEAAAEQIAGLTPYQRTFARNGLMDELKRVMREANKEGRRNVADSLLDDQTGRLVQAIVGPDEAEKIRRVLSTESELFRTAQAASPRAGSDTGIVVGQAIDQAMRRRTMTGALLEMSGGVIDDILKNVRAGKADEAGRLLLQQIDNPDTAPEVKIFLIEVARRVKERLRQAGAQMGGSGALAATGATFL